MHQVRDDDTFWSVLVKSDVGGHLYGAEYVLLTKTEIAAAETRACSQWQWAGGHIQGTCLLWSSKCISIHPLYIFWMCIKEPEWKFQTVKKNHKKALTLSSGGKVGESERHQLFTVSWSARLQIFTMQTQMEPVRLKLDRVPIGKSCALTSSTSDLTDKDWPGQQAGLVAWQEWWGEANGKQHCWPNGVLKNVWYLNSIPSTESPYHFSVHVEYFQITPTQVMSPQNVLASVVSGELQINTRSCKVQPQWAAELDLLSLRPYWPVCLVSKGGWDAFQPFTAPHMSQPIFPRMLTQKKNNTVPHEPFLDAVHWV